MSCVFASPFVAVNRADLLGGTVSGTGLCAQRGGILHRAPAAAIPLLQLRARVYARWVAPARTLDGHAWPPGRGEDSSGDQLYDP